MQKHYFQTVQRILKKPASIVLALVFCLTPAVSVSAVGDWSVAQTEERQSFSETRQAALSEALNGVEAQKICWRNLFLSLKM